MRVVLVATGVCPDLDLLNQRCPPAMLPLGDRPFIQHVVESLARLGATQFDVLLSHLPEKVENHLGDGKRWGVAITYHLVRDPLRPYRMFRILALDDEGKPVLLGHPDRLPILERDHVSGPPALFGWKTPAADGHPGWSWTGWALLGPGRLKQIPSDATEDTLESHLTAPAGAEAAIPRVDVPKPLSARTCAEYLDAHRRLLDHTAGELILGGREVEPGVWLSRNVVLHPTANVVPPVYLGADCQIGRGVTVGPYAVIGSQCLLDAGCTMSEAAVLPGSYIGEGLELSEVVVDRNLLLNVRVGGAMTVTDDFILGSFTENHLQRAVTRLASQTLGIVVVAAASPLIGLTALWLKLFRAGPVLYTREVVRLPTGQDPQTWKTFKLWSFLRPPSTAERAEGAADVAPSALADLWLRVLPGLVNVARGHLRFVGEQPRTREEIETLSRDWAILYLHAKAGLISEAYVYHGPYPTEDEQYAAEANYAVSAGWFHDFRLVLGYFRQVCFGSPMAERYWLRVREEELSGAAEDAVET